MWLTSLIRNKNGARMQHSGCPARWNWGIFPEGGLIYLGHLNLPWDKTLLSWGNPTDSERSSQYGESGASAHGSSPRRNTKMGMLLPGLAVTFLGSCQSVSSPFSALVHFVLLWQNVTDWLIYNVQKLIAHNSGGWEIQYQDVSIWQGPCCVIAWEVSHGRRVKRELRKDRTCALIFLYLFVFGSTEVFYFCGTYYAINSEGMGTSSSGSFPLALAKCASLGGAGWHFSWTQVPFSLVSFLFW